MFFSSHKLYKKPTVRRATPFANETVHMVVTYLGFSALPSTLLHSTGNIKANLSKEGRLHDYIPLTVWPD